MTMHNADTPESTTILRDPMGARKRRYAVMIVLLTLLHLWLIQNPYFPSGTRLILIAVTLLGLVRWTAAILLLLIQVDLALYESTWRVSREPPMLLIAVGTVTLLMILSRLRSAQELTGVRGAAELLRSSGGRPDTAGEERREQSGSGAEEPLWVTGLSLTLVLAAGLLLQIVPIDQTSVREYGLTPAGMRAIRLGLFLFTAWLLIALPLGEWRWRQLTPDQAGVYLRTHFVSWLHRDLRAVERRKRRLNNKRLRALRRASRRSSSHASQKAD